jgi:hypothetical protein
MLVRLIASKDLIEIDDIDQLINPFNASVKGQSQAGEEQQEAALYGKDKLEFTSGEPLPRSWRDPHFKTRDEGRVADT